ncbi:MULTISPECIES: gamma-glutamylcyclotransferase family protein [unclassified Paenibacillus]|uniref:gamma-glutamylcyclotransferase family protein n=1 Tax=unclassified Paenibacillus TaxID=185978 RepID=UPI00362E8732
MISVFVYGTLLVGESNHHVVAPHLLEVEAGAVLGELYGCGSYPAVVIGGGSHVVHGEWLTVTEEGLSAMDVLEEYYGPGADNDYERVWVHDAFTKREGWIYVWLEPRGNDRIKEGSWRAYNKKES